MRCENDRVAAARVHAARAKPHNFGPHQLFTRRRDFGTFSEEGCPMPERVFGMESRDLEDRRARARRYYAQHRDRICRRGCAMNQDSAVRPNWSTTKNSARSAALGTAARISRRSASRHCARKLETVRAIDEQAASLITGAIPRVRARPPAALPRASPGAPQRAPARARPRTVCG